jgi:hypothetical protein
MKGFRRSYDDPVPLEPDRYFASRQSASRMCRKRCKPVMKRLDRWRSGHFHHIQQPQHSVAFHILAPCEFPQFAISR